MCLKSCAYTHTLEHINTAYTHTHSSINIELKFKSFLTEGVKKVVNFNYPFDKGPSILNNFSIRKGKKMENSVKRKIHFHSFVCWKSCLQKNSLFEVFLSKISKVVCKTICCWRKFIIILKARHEKYIKGVFSVVNG